MDKAKIDQLYAETTCAVFPSASVPLLQAKCSVRLATTLLQGVPVVASAVGQQSEYGANGAAHLVAAEASPAIFAMAVHEVIQADQTRDEIAQRAREHLSKHFAWESLGNSLMQFYLSRS